MKKFYLDISLLILFLLVMSFHFIPKVLHEVLGLFMLAVIVVHFYWNISAFKSLRGTTKKRLSLLIDAALLICIIVIIATGICISNHLFNGMIDMRLQRNITIHQLHVSLPFLFMILIGLHLGLHWQGVWQRVINIFKFDKSSRIFKIVCHILIASLIVAGVYGSILNRVGDKLLMEHVFATEATNLPFISFLVLMIGFISIYTLIGFIINKYFR